MRSIVLYPYPVENDGVSLQGHYLLKGLQKLGQEAVPCHRFSNEEKEKLYKDFKPDVAFGIGFWGDIPEIASHPLSFGVTPVPWLNADAWVANYHTILNKLPLILATSNWVKSTYIRDGVKPNNIKVAPIGYDPEIFFPRDKNDKQVKKVRSSLGIKDDELMILTAGGDVTSKGAQEILKALSLLNKKFKKWKYVCKIWPSPSARDHGKVEKELINLFGFQDKVIYLNKKYNPKKIATLMNASDIYAAPSRLEGFGMFQLEAQACGKPVVSINVGGPKDTILHEKTGFLADVDYEVKLESEWAYEKMGFEKKHKIHFPEPKTFAYRANVEQLSKYLLRLMKNNKLRKTMGEAAAIRAYKKFNYEVTSKHISNLVKKYILN